MLERGEFLQWSLLAYKSILNPVHEFRGYSWIRAWMQLFSNHGMPSKSAFCWHLWRWSCGFCLSLMWYRFADFSLSNHPCIPAMNSTSSWSMIFFFYCAVKFVLLARHWVLLTHLSRIMFSLLPISLPCLLFYRVLCFCCPSNLPW